MTTRISSASRQDTRPIATSNASWIPLLAVLIGLAAAIIILPAWMPNITASLLGADAKFYWYLSRATAFVGYGLLWLSMSMGIMITNKMARIWPGGPTAAALHQHTSLLGLGFGLVHGSAPDRRPVHPLHPRPGAHPLYHRQLPAPMGRSGTVGLLHLGTGRPELLHPQSDRPQNLAHHPLCQLPRLCPHPAARHLQRHRHRHRVGHRPVLGQRQHDPLPDLLPHPIQRQQSTAGSNNLQILDGMQ